MSAIPQASQIDFLAFAAVLHNINSINMKCRKCVLLRYILKEKKRKASIEWIVTLTVAGYRFSESYVSLSYIFNMNFLYKNEHIYI